MQCCISSIQSFIDKDGLQVRLNVVKVDEHKKAFFSFLFFFFFVQVLFLILSALVLRLCAVTEVRHRR